MKRDQELAGRDLEGHTVRRYDGELNHLHMTVLEMGGLVLDQVRLALQALRHHDDGMVDEVKSRENQVDALEVKLDEQIAHVIARRGPVAKDLRVIIAFSKAVADLERIGDEAAKVAILGGDLYPEGNNGPSDMLIRDAHIVGKVARDMLQEALDVLDSLSVSRAARLVNSEQNLDEEFQSSLRRLTTFVMEDARNVGHVVTITLILKALERIGDHAKNLAEYVIYMVEGQDVRHHDNPPPVSS
ncbi:MAG: phosphate signaling complex protein PhoU [Pseudomonadota bacterium]|nr:phosphate signaling complex protein PhoU [Pseudomonadota bacterium]